MHREYNLQKPNFTIENIDALNIIRGKGYKHSYRNGRLKHGFIYVVSGSLLYNFAERCTIKAGQLLFVPQNTVYTTTYLEDQTQIKIVQFELASGNLPDYLSIPHIIDLPTVGELIDPFFYSTTNHSFYYLSCLYALLWRIDEQKSKIPTKYKKLKPVLSEISDNFTQNKKIAHYATLCDMSEPNFRRLFREYTGYSPVDYRNALRLNDARIKLQSGEYNVSEAAESSGFSNLSFFIRLYKKKYGYTPKQE